MLRSVFELAVRAVARCDILKSRFQLCKVIRMNRAAEYISNEFFRRPSQHILYAWTHKRARALETEYRDDVRKAGHQAANKFLLLMQVLFHFEPLAYVHQRPLNAQDAACGISNHSAGIKTVDGLAVLAPQHYFAVF